MNFSGFFIERPIFATVVSAVIVLAGLLALRALPIAQYPEISPPTIQLTALYPGASAQIMAETVATPIEEQVNGAQDMLYMSSTSPNNGQMVMNVTFAINRDPDLAQVDVQNRLALAEPLLPSQVLQEGISVRKQSTSFVTLLALSSPSGTYDQLFLSNYATINLVDPLSRLPGVGNVNVFGEQNYGMRIWLNPDRLAALDLTPNDVAGAVESQNIQAPAGQIGQPPAPPGQQFQYTVQVQGRLTTISQFKNIIVRANPDGTFVRVKDVARVDLGAQLYNAFDRFNGHPAVIIAVYELPGANALQVAREVRAAMASLTANLPPGMKYTVALDTSAFVTASIREVLITLLIAFGLVFLVVLIFLQSLRATLIPAVAVPVSLLGAIAVFVPLGFSLNTLTLFGLVLAIGLVVDDAIVVVEAVQRHIDEDGVDAKEAARRAMGEVSGPVVAVALVLSAVFVPVAFVGGITGALYRQFALTMAASVLISAFEALTLSPALCGLLLRPSRTSGGVLTFFSRGFNRAFGGLTRAYEAAVKHAIAHRLVTLLALVAIGTGAWYVLDRLPTSFVPLEDQGYFVMSVQLPAAAALERTAAAVNRIEGILKRTPGVQNVVAAGGLNFVSGTYASNAAALFVILKPWDQRTTRALSLASIMGAVESKTAQLPQAIIMSFNPPPIPGLGTTGGFQFELENRGNHTVQQLAAEANRLVAASHSRPELGAVFTTYQASVPQVRLNVDRAKALTLGVPVSQVFNEIGAYLGGLYVNQFNLFGRTYQVLLQAQPEFRSSSDELGRFYLKSATGKMIPLTTLVAITPAFGPDNITHYNLYPSIEIEGAAAPGYSSGQAIAAMAQVAAKMPAGYGYEWTGLSYQEIHSTGQLATFVLALVFVFLFLAAQYESWIVPLAVLLAVPLGVFGAVLSTWARGLDNDVYFEIGLVMLIGLAAKNAILIVEFAKTRHEHGLALAEAAIEGARVRFRPILMTSFAFIFGILPLVIAAGAGSAARHSLGTTVFGGMIAATALGVLFVPVFFVVMVKASEWLRTGHRAKK